MEDRAVFVKARSVLDAISRLCRTVSAVLLALISALVFGQVVGRNVFDLGLPWADELARFSGIAIVFLCVPLLALRGQNVSVDIVPQSLPPHLRRYLLMVGEAAVFGFCVLTLAGFQSFLSRAWKFVTPAIGIPNWLFYAPALTGFVLLLLVTLLRFLELAGTPADRKENP